MPYRIKFRRRREGKTDYYKRKVFVISEKIRFCVRRSNKYLLIQFLKHDPKGDVTLLAVHSSKLKKYGWQFSCVNIPACYLTGYLAGLKALKKGIKEAVLDMGLRPATKGSRIFAAVKGALDAGLNIPVSEEVLPSEDRILGKHILNYYNLLKDKNEHEKRFKVSVENIEESFEKVKSMITKIFSA